MAEIITGKTFEAMGINTHGKAGQFKIKYCPTCKANGHKNDNDYSVSINSNLGKGRCWKCGTLFIIDDESTTSVKVIEDDNSWTPPSREKLENLEEAGMAFLVSRRITNEAAEHAMVCQSTGAKDSQWLAFLYYENGVLVNVKYRKLDKKGFQQSPNGKHIVYNYDNCKGKKKIVLVEGEMDVLAFMSAGYGLPNDDWGICSLDSGSPNLKDKNIDGKLKCVTNSYDIFEQAEEIYLAMDGDANGQRMQRELIRRLDSSKIKIIQFTDDEQDKDANAVLMWGDLKKKVSEAVDFTPDGIFTFDNSWDEIVDALENGFAEGSTTYFPSIDERFQWRTGDVTILTGYNNDGKSTLLSNMTTIKGLKDEWPTALFSPESMPKAKFFLKTAGMVTGRSTKTGWHDSLTKDDLLEAKRLMHNLLFMVHPSEAKTLDALFERFEYLVKRYGVRIVVIDPLNTIEGLFSKAISIDQGISDLMGRLKTFALEYDVAIVLVAHQNPPKQDAGTKDYEKPSKYRIKNGGTISDKADNVLLLWRPLSFSVPTDTRVTLISEKLKDDGLTGKKGDCEVDFMWQHNRYIDDNLGGKSPFDTDGQPDGDRSKTPKQVDLFDQVKADRDYGSMRNIPISSEESKEMAENDTEYLPF